VWPLWQYCRKENTNLCTDNHGKNPLQWVLMNICLRNNNFLFHFRGSHMELMSGLGWLMASSVVLVNTDSFSFLTILFFSLCYHFCLSLLYAMVLIPWVFCCYGLGYFSHSCFALVFSDSGVKWSSCLSYMFLPVFASDAVYPVLCFLDFILGFSLHENAP
jgi:hypothetical protein